MTDTTYQQALDAYFKADTWFEALCAFLGCAGLEGKPVAYHMTEAGTLEITVDNEYGLGLGSDGSFYYIGG